MFEGRERCRELIRELQSTHSLEESAQERRRSTKSTMFALYREQNEKYLQDNRICDILDSLEGSTVAGMLDMLNKVSNRPFFYRLFIGLNLFYNYLILIIFYKIFYSIQN